RDGPPGQARLREARHAVHGSDRDRPHHGPPSLEGRGAAVRPAGPLPRGVRPRRRRKGPHGPRGLHGPCDRRGRAPLPPHDEHAPRDRRRPRDGRARRRAPLNLEYVQFHPTTLYHPDAEGFLISEALRGEGAVLVNRAGEPFMRRYAPGLKDLAPRDIVTRAIVEEMTSRGEPCVYLDLAHHYRVHEGQSIKERFPTIAATCQTFGIDIATEPIPVVPAAHYHCG